MVNLLKFSQAWPLQTCAFTYPQIQAGGCIGATFSGAAFAPRSHHMGRLVAMSGQTASSPAEPIEATLFRSASARQGPRYSTDRRSRSPPCAARRRGYRRNTADCVARPLSISPIACRDICRVRLHAQANRARAASRSARCRCGARCRWSRYRTAPLRSPSVWKNSRRRIAAKRVGPS